MKNIIFLFLISCNICLAEFNFSGNIDYSQQENRQLTSSNSIQHIAKLYESHKYLVSISNTLTVDLDQFKNEIKEANVFTTLRIEF